LAGAFSNLTSLGFTGVKVLTVGRQLVSPKDPLRVEPGAFEGLANLEFLFANDNYLTVDVTAEDMEGTLSTTLTPDFTEGLSKLRVLELGDNDFEAIHPHAFDGVKDLEILEMRSNHVRMLPQGIYLGELRALNFNDNALQGILPSTFHGFPKLQLLLLEQNTNLAYIGTGAFRGLAQKALVMSPSAGRYFSYCENDHDNGTVRCQCAWDLYYKHDHSNANKTFAGGENGTCVCVPGQYLVTVFEIPVCFPCEHGHYNPVGGELTQCTPCPAGRDYTLTIGTADLASCTVNPEVAKAQATNKQQKAEAADEKRNLIGGGGAFGVVLCILAYSIQVHVNRGFERREREIERLQVPR